MKKYLLVAIFFSSIIVSAQTNSNDSICKAGFKYEFNTMFMSPLPVTAINFYDVSDGNVINWFWDFGDGTTSEEQNPMHVFDRPVSSPNVKINPYRAVSLTILTSDSCKSIFSDTINIMEGAPIENLYCKAAFKYYQADYDSVTGMATIQFTNLSEGDSLGYFWEFNNGKSSTEKEPQVNFDMTQFEYKVCLTITGSDSCSDIFCDAVYIKNPNDTVSNPLECYTGFGYKINYDIMTFAPALVLDFYSKADPVAVEWFWDFDDGTTSNEENPMHIFNYPVITDSVLADPNPFREVCLTVKTVTGCVVSYCETINIYMNDSLIKEPELECKAAFKYYQADYDSVTGMATIQFEDRSEGDSLRYFWQFDDGITSTEKEPRVSFDINQYEIEVCLTVTGADSCSDVFCDAVNISNPNECYTGFGYKINYDIQTFAPALVLDFYSKADPVAVEWNWDFGDGMTSNEENPTHIFNYPVIVDSTLEDPNPFREVCLTVKTVAGCKVSYCETINVYMYDSLITEPELNYIMRYESSFPPEMSSCAGIVKAQVYLGDSLIDAHSYKWSHGVEGQEAKGFCPTQTYTVKAKTPDGHIVSGMFVFNSDGTVTETPINWWISGEKDDATIQYNLNKKGYFVEWKLCDGTYVTADSIQLDLINCDSLTTLVLKDSLGNIVYSENISRAIMTSLVSVENTQKVKLFPNPVKDVLNIQYSGQTMEEITIEIYDFNGKTLINQNMQNIESGQNIGLNVNALKNGIYLCRISSGNQTIRVEKFIK